MVRPGDKMIIEAWLDEIKPEGCWTHARITVDGTEVASAAIIFVHLEDAMPESFVFTDNFMDLLDVSGVFDASERVVVTGIGVAERARPLGRRTTSRRLSPASAPSRPIAAFPVGDFPVKYAVELKDFRAAKFLKNRKSIKVMARDIQISVSAASLAARDAGIYDGSRTRPASASPWAPASCRPSSTSSAPPSRRASTRTSKFDLRKFGKEGLAATQPLWLLKYLPNMVNSTYPSNTTPRGPTTA